VSGGKNLIHSGAPSIVKSPSFEDGEEAGPLNRVEGLTKVNLEDDGGRLSSVAASKEVRGIDDVLRDTPPREEPCLISVHE
jgi:hypothetical protein